MGDIHNHHHLLLCEVTNKQPFMERNHVFLSNILHGFIIQGSQHFSSHEKQDLEHLYNTNNGRRPQPPPAPSVKRSYGLESNGTILEKGVPLREDVDILFYTCIQKMPFA